MARNDLRQELAAALVDAGIAVEASDGTHWTGDDIAGWLLERYRVSPAPRAGRAVKSDAPSAYYSVSEAAGLLGVSPVTAYRWVNEERFPVPVVQVYGTLRVPRVRLDKYVAKLAAKAS